MKDCIVIGTASFGPYADVWRKNMINFHIKVLTEYEERLKELKKARKNIFKRFFFSTDRKITYAIECIEIEKNTLLELGATSFKVSQ
jgi:hypothetical protein